MFRKGGSTGGITSGMRRGYNVGGGADARRWVTDTETVTEEAPQQTDLSFLEDYNIKPPEAPGFDWGSFGLNLMSGPSTGDIISDIGEAGKEPYSRYKQGRAAYDMNKYKHKLAERQFGLEVYKAMNDDDKLRVQQEMEFYMNQGMTEEEAFNQVIYRKKQHPDETKRIQDQEKLEAQKENLTLLLGNYADDNIGQGVALTPQQGKKVQKFHEWAQENKKQFQPYNAVIDSTDIIIGQLQTSPNTGNKILPENVDNETYIPGFHYIDPMTNTVWLVSESGQELIPVEMD
jgi:hypothetical protein